jgi:polyisoprenoid-binding protein YceI
MKRFMMMTGLAATLVFPALSQAGWKVDKSHSQVNFGVTHLMVAKVRGEFKEYTGDVDLNEKDLTKSKLNMEIDVASINTNNAKRDKHLRSGDFFLAEKHPKLTFTATKIKKGKGKGALKVTGDLTMRGVTKPVTLDVTVTDLVKGPWGSQRRGVSVRGKVNRNDWGISWNKTFDGGVLVGDDVTIEVDLSMMKDSSDKG